MSDTGLFILLSPTDEIFGQTEKHCPLPHMGMKEVIKLLKKSPTTMYISCQTNYKHIYKRDILTTRFICKPQDLEVGCRVLRKPKKKILRTKLSSYIGHRDFWSTDCRVLNYCIAAMICEAPPKGNQSSSRSLHKHIALS